MEISFPGGMRVDARSNGHTVKTDQPLMGGGDGSAPTPFALFLASIGTCAGIYVLGFCQQRNIPTDEIRLTQNIQVDPLTRMVTQVTLDIDLPADFPERYRTALIKSAELCAVKKHLERPPSFSIAAHIGTV